MVKFKDRIYNCPMELAVDIIGGKWKALILWHLSIKTLRFNELKRIFPKLSQKILTQQLRSLEEDGLINRIVYPQVPPKVEYSLSDLGKSLISVLQEMNRWGANYIIANDNRDT